MDCESHEVHYSHQRQAAGLVLTSHEQQISTLVNDAIGTIVLSTVAAIAVLLVLRIVLSAAILCWPCVCGTLVVVCAGAAAALPCKIIERKLD